MVLAAEFDHVANMGGHPRGPDPFDHILLIGKSEMLGRCHITYEVRAISRGLGGSYGGGYMVVPGAYIGCKGAENIKGGVIAHPLLEFHIGFDVIERQMARPLAHGLAAHLPADIGELAVYEQLLYLRPVEAVVNRACPEAIAQAQDAVVFAKYLDYPVKLLVKGVFFVVAQHPADHVGPTP